ncbi:MAG TPA: RHS repeat-associated core domain-containing protein [Moraxellaceae bacterium]|nr:RHS repeat-associated core domain-containing protein [Moraxellaceae bacterium]
MTIATLMMKAMRWLAVVVLALAGTTGLAAEYVTYLHADVQGSPLLATDEQGQVVWQEEYEPWGARQVKDAASATPGRGSKVWYTGKEEEAALGMYYYGARWYMPNVGQFTATDPATVSLNNARSFNRYAYANNNPISYVDPDGRYAVLAAAAVAYAFLTFVDYANAPGPGDQLYREIQWTPLLSAIPAGWVKGVGGIIINANKQRPPSSDGAEVAVDAGRAAAKAPKSVEEITNPPQAPVIPQGWESRAGRTGGEIYFPKGTDPSKGEHIRVMPGGSSPVPGLENGYWRWVNSNKQPMNPATGRVGKGQGDTHVPLPANSMPPTRRTGESE